MTTDTTHSPQLLPDDALNTFPEKTGSSERAYWKRSLTGTRA